MLLHTVDWWPRESNGAGSQTRDRLAGLFPAATLDDTAHALVADQQWALCRQLYDHILYHQLAEGLLLHEAVLGISAANVRLVSYLWPAGERGLLATALGGVAEYAMGRRLTKKGLYALKCEVDRLLEAMTSRGESVAVRQSVESVVAVLRAGARSQTDSDLARHSVRVLSCVEAAAMYAVPEGRSLGRTRAIAAARAEIWQSAFLYLDLAVSDGWARLEV
jgi:hypothetical protein